MRVRLPSMVAILLGVAALIAAAAGAQAAGGSAVGSKSPPTERVSVADDHFSPRSLSVSRGTRVVWRWKGANEHNVRFRNVPNGVSKRGSDTQSSGRFARILDKRGTYRYVCTIHQDLGMKGSVNVR